MIRVIQCNLNRSRPALDLLFQYTLDENIAVCLVSEMPRLRNPNKQWVISEDGLSGIFYRPEMTGSLMIPGECSLGIAVANLGKVTVVSCYLSPNGNRADALEFFDRLSDVVDAIDRTVVIANVGIRCLQLAWSLAGRLDCGKRSMCSKHWIHSDMRSSSGQLGNRYNDIFSGIILTYCILEEVTSLSDHCYVYYEIVNHVNNVNSSNNSNNNYIESRNVSRFPSWSWVAFEEKSFCSALAWYTPEALGMLSDDAIDPDTISCKIKQVLADAADFSAKRKRGNRRMKSTYWWNPDIAILRSEVLHTRRKWMRYIRRCNDYWL